MSCILSWETHACGGGSLRDMPLDCEVFWIQGPGILYHVVGSAACISVIARRVSVPA